jgi:hypothetical protein
MCTSFILIVILFEKAFNMAMVRNFQVNVGTNAEPLCVEFCNFVQCHIFVNYITC